MSNRLFNAEEEKLLQAVVTKVSPEAVPLLDLIGVRPLTSRERELLRGTLAFEMTAEGLDDHDEPNSYGLRLDHLIGRLAEH